MFPILETKQPPEANSCSVMESTHKIPDTDTRTLLTKTCILEKLDTLEEKRITIGIRKIALSMLIILM